MMLIVQHGSRRAFALRFDKKQERILLQTHISKVDGNEYYADSEVLLGHVVTRHFISNDENAGIFDAEIIGRSAADFWYMVTYILDNGAFAHGASNALGNIHPIIWYFDFFKATKRATGKGKSKAGNSCELKGVRVIAHADSYADGKVGYLVQTVYPCGEIKAS